MVTLNTNLVLPKGITLSKNKTTFRIQTRKNVMIDGKKDKLKDFGTVKINYEDNMTPQQRQNTFDAALKEAKKNKLLQIERLSKGTVTKENLKKLKAVGTLKATYDALFAERWGHSKTGNDINISQYAKDVFSYFPSDVRLDAMQTHEYYKGFVEHCKKAIENRKANHMATVSTKTINKRLGLLRDIFRYGIAHGLLDQSKLLNPDLRITNMGWENLAITTVKKKMALTGEEERKVLDKAKELGEHDFCDALVWLCDTGMRQRSEFLKFTIDNVDFKRNIVHFHRPKTDVWTTVFLTPRAKEIALRLKDRANLREDKRVFGHFTGRSMRTLFDKFRKWCKIPDFTPYVTRHTFMTKLGKNKTPPPTIAVLGGVTIETAQKYYVHSNTEMEEEAIENLNGTNDMRGHNSRNRID